VPTSKGQALADEYGIKFFETVSGNMLSRCNLRLKNQSFCSAYTIRICSAECKDKYECGGGLLFNREGY
jgi:hypothetical protein